MITTKLQLSSIMGLNSIILKVHYEKKWPLDDARSVQTNMGQHTRVITATNCSCNQLVSSVSYAASISDWELRVELQDKNSVIQ